MNIKNCKAGEFINNLNGRKVICFGAGSMLRRPENDILGTIVRLEDHIDFFVDSNHSKHNLEYEYNGKKFKIYGPDILDRIDSSKYVLLITVGVAVDVYLQLKEKKNIENLDCYLYRMVISFPEIDIKTYLEREINKPAYLNMSKRIEKFKNIHKGKRCFIIGNGPSLNIKDLEVLNKEITFAVNRIYYVFEDTFWRPTYYLCFSPGVYHMDYNEINNLNLKNKFISRLASMASGKIYDDIYYYKELYTGTIIDNKKIVDIKNRNFSYDIASGVCLASGSTVLYNVLQFAVYMGFTEIYLLGVDFNYKTEILPDGTIQRNDVKTHFNDKLDRGFENILDIGFVKSEELECWQSAKEACEKVGVTIKNATRGGKLEVFERVDFDELMKNKT